MSRKLSIFAGSLLLSLGAVSASAQTPVGEVFAADASVRGSVLLAGHGTQVLSGSQVAAGARPAVMRLTRGGELRICPNTMVGVAASPNGRNLMFSLSSGDVEFHFDIGSDGDAMQTPDFRVQFIGPGHFDLAICTDNRGGLAVRGANNRSAIIVSEMMGDGVYQVPGGSNIDFHNGSVRDATASDSPCGCPEAPESRTPVAVAQNTEPPPPPPPPVTQPPETHIQVEAPMIFRGEAPEEDISFTVAKLQTRSAVDMMVRLESQVLAPPPPQQQDPVVRVNNEQPPRKRGFFRKIGRFFGKIFRG